MGGRVVKEGFGEEGLWGGERLEGSGVGDRDKPGRGERWWAGCFFLGRGGGELVGGVIESFIHDFVSQMGEYRAWCYKLL